SAATERTIRLWDTHDGGSYMGRFEECPASISALGLHKDERIFLSGMDNGSLIFWDSVTGKSSQRLVCHEDAINSIALSGNGVYAITAGADGLVGVWNVRQMKLIKTFNTGDSNVLSAAFCQSDERYFTCGTMEGTIYVYNMEVDECLFTLTAHTDGVNALVFSQNGFYLYSASLDGTVVRWFIEWELTSEENIAAKQTLKQIMTQYISYISADDSTVTQTGQLQTILNAAGLSHLIDDTFEETLKQIAHTQLKKALTRQPLIQEEIAVAPTEAEVKIKAETTWLKKVFIATVIVVLVVVAAAVVHNMKTTRYNTAQFEKLAKEDVYFSLVYDAVKFMDKPPSGCSASNIDAYKESYSVFIKQKKAVVVSLHPKSRENISCLIALRTDKVVVKNLIFDMVQGTDQGYSQSLSVLLSYMGNDALSSLTDLLSSEGFVRGNTAGGRLVVSTLAMMGTPESSNALADLAISNAYLGPIVAPNLGRIFSFQKLSPQRALELIESLMTSADEQVRKDAVGALIFIKGSRAKVALEKAVSDTSAEVSGEAKRVSQLF
ncbi:MAG: hypothetical protein HQK97_07370, partial [Nitrospirae bacterium]|nr:hypothetical protein [Nitrospirota bacterium]